MKLSACNRLPQNCIAVFLFLAFLNISHSQPVTLQQINPELKKNLAEQWLQTIRIPAEKFANNILLSMEDNAVLLALEDIPTLSLWLLKKGKKIPPTVTIYDFDGTYFQPLSLKNGETLETYINSHPNRVIEDIFLVRQKPEYELITGSKLPVYSTSRRDTSDLPGFQLIPSGLVYQFWKEGMKKPDYKVLVKKITPMDNDIEENPSSDIRNMAAITRYMRGMNFLQMEESWSKISAKMEFRLAAKFADDLKGIHAMLAENFIVLKDLDNAYLSAEKAIEKKPDSPKSYFVMGDYYEARNNMTRAIENYTQALTMDSGNTAAKFKLGTFFRSNNKPETALHWFEIVTNESPDYADAYKLSAEIYEQEGNLSKAVENYRKYIEVAPDNKNIAEIKRKVKKLEKLDK